VIAAIGSLASGIPQSVSNRARVSGFRREGITSARAGIHRGLGGGSSALTKIGSQDLPSHASEVVKKSVEHLG
jgi:hypothetical protein